jgi:hypothetical protein
MQSLSRLVSRLSGTATSARESHRYTFTPLQPRKTGSSAVFRLPAGLPPPQLRNSLTVLLQHNCIGAYLQHEEGRMGSQGRLTTIYEALLPAILQNLRSG